MYIEDASIEAEKYVGIKYILAQLHPGLRQLRIYYWGTGKAPETTETWLQGLGAYLSKLGFRDDSLAELSYDEPDKQGWNYVALRIGDAFKDQFSSIMEIQGAIEA